LDAKEANIHVDDLPKTESGLADWHGPALGLKVHSFQKCRILGQFMYFILLSSPQAWLWRFFGKKYAEALG
jgi:hypothetical protein